MKNEQKISAKRERFNKKYDGLADSEILKENLYAQQLIYDKLEKIRTNTSNIVWFLIVIPIIFIIISVMF